MVHWTSIDDGDDHLNFSDVSESREEKRREERKRGEEKTREETI